MKAKKSKQFFHTSLRILKLVWKISKKYTLLLGLFTVAQGLIPVTSAWIGKLIIDTVILAINSGDPNSYVVSVILLVIIELVIIILSSFMRYYTLWINDRLKDLLVQHIETLILKKAVSLDLSFFENPDFYNKLRNAEAEAGYRPITLLSEVFRLIQSFIALIPFVLILLSFNWIITLAAILISLPYIVVQSNNARVGYFLLRDRAPESRKLAYVKHLLTQEHSAKEIQLFNLGNYLLSKYSSIFNKIHKENKSFSLRKNLSAFILESISAIGLYGCYAYIVYQTILQYISIGDLTLYFQSMTQIQTNTSNIFISISTIWEQTLFMDNLFEFLSLEPKISSAPNAISFPQKNCHVEFKNVSFVYPGTKKYVLQNINLRFQQGATIALVGENGSGKTTLIKLLARLYDPTEGEILINNVNIKQIDLHELRHNIGIIFQDFVRYSMTVQENIGFGKIEELNNIERITEVARQSQAHKMIASLPLGYETMLGKLFDGGQQLSVGQWQKIALARALMRDDAQVLVLDEPTASLDPRTEYEIFNQFSHLVEGRTAILVSHRLSTVCMADHIIVLNKGRIVEQGNHNDLLDLNGEYAQLFNMQAEKYR